MLAARLAPAFAAVSGWRLPRALDDLRAPTPRGWWTARPVRTPMRIRRSLRLGAGVVELAPRTIAAREMRALLDAVAGMVA